MTARIQQSIPVFSQVRTLPRSSADDPRIAALAIRGLLRGYMPKTYAACLRKSKLSVSSSFQRQAQTSAKRSCQQQQRWQTIQLTYLWLPKTDEEDLSRVNAPSNNTRKENTQMVHVGGVHAANQYHLNWSVCDTS